MKKRTVHLALILSLSLFSSILAGCGDTTSADKTESSVSISETADESESEVDAKEEEEPETESEPEKAEESSNKKNSETATIEEQVLYDENDIKITATGLETGMFGTDLKLLIENNSDTNYTVQSRNTSVNGFMIEPMMSVDVAAGKKANDTLSFMSSQFEECGVEKIANMELSFHIFDTETWEENIDSSMISIDTSIADTYEQPVDDSGEVLVDTNGVKIVSKGLSENDSFWGPGVVVYIENNTEENITVQARDVSVNGFMVESSISQDVIAGKKAITAVQFFSQDLEANSITDIEDVELSFHVFNLESWDTIFDSDVISIKF